MVSINFFFLKLCQQIRWCSCSYSTHTVFLHHYSEAELILFTVTGVLPEAIQNYQVDPAEELSSVFEIHKLFVFRLEFGPFTLLLYN